MAVQKLPILLDEVHLIIEKYGVHFLLTGSSARKLHRAGVNFLGGRARVQHLHPFTYRELGANFNLHRALETGLMPNIFFSDDPFEDLQSYCGTYLKEEIVSEALVRNIPSFSRFLTVAALSNANILNYSNVSNDAKVAVSTVKEYYQILRDTLIGFDLPAWGKGVKRKDFQTSKFYLFDIGVTRSIQQRKILTEGTAEYGEAFESYIFHELKCFCDYESKQDLHYWRSLSGYEVDFILGNEIAIEVKAKKSISASDLKGLKAIADEAPFKKRILVSLEETPRVVDDIEILPYNIFLERLWGTKGSFE